MLHDVLTVNNLSYANLCTFALTASLWKDKFWNRFKCSYTTTWQQKMEKQKMQDRWDDEPMICPFSLFFSLSEPWCHPRFKSPLAGVSASLTWNQRKSKACVREQETRVRGKRWRARKEGPGERKEAWEQIFRGKKKLMGTDRLRWWDRQRWGSSKSDSASLISYSFVLKWQILHDRYWSQLNWKRCRNTHKDLIDCV